MRIAILLVAVFVSTTAVADDCVRYAGTGEVRDTAGGFAASIELGPDARATLLSSNGVVVLTCRIGANKTRIDLELESDVAKFAAGSLTGEIRINSTEKTVAADVLACGGAQ